MKALLDHAAIAIRAAQARIVALEIGTKEGQKRIGAMKGQTKQIEVIQPLWRGARDAKTVSF